MHSTNFSQNSVGSGTGHGRKPLDFGDNPDRVWLGLGLRLGWGGVAHYSAWEDVFV